MAIAERITADRDTLGGIACIRGLNFSAAELLRLLATGMSAEEIVAEYPDLERDDIPATLRYAAIVVNAPRAEPDQASGEAFSG